MTDAWFHTMEQDLHAADVATQKALMMEIIETGYQQVKRQYPLDAAKAAELEAAYAWLKARVQAWQS
jgi:hypothetical protein